MKWRAMRLAPLDGTPIIALHEDSSGVEAIRWGERDVDESGVDAGWYKLDYSDRAFVHYAGWIPAPPLASWNNVTKAKGRSK